MKDNSTISRIRQVRHLISEEAGHDPKTLVQYYIRLQNKRKDEDNYSKTSSEKLAALEADSLVKQRAAKADPAAFKQA